jgi:hypothetical protein
MHAGCLVSAGASEACCDALRSLRCYACDGVAALTTGSTICPSMCDTLLSACADDFFSWDARGTPAVCDGGDAVCAQLKEAGVTSNEFCSQLGLPTSASGGAGGRDCFDGSARQPPAAVAQAIAAQRAAAAGADAGGQSGSDTDAGGLAALVADAYAAVVRTALAPLRRTSYGKTVAAALEEAGPVPVLVAVVAALLAWRHRRRGGTGRVAAHEPGARLSAEELRERRLQRLGAASPPSTGGSMAARPIDDSDTSDSDGERPGVPESAAAAAAAKARTRKEH